MNNGLGLSTGVSFVGANAVLFITLLTTHCCVLIRISCNFLSSLHCCFAHNKENNEISFTHTSIKSGKTTTKPRGSQVLRENISYTSQFHSLTHSIFLALEYVTPSESGQWGNKGFCPRKMLPDLGLCNTRTYLWDANIHLLLAISS